ncbi:hypothetical protein J6590_008641 [Homalodisca vitripennis]|nr:hypothetical protein J6590_008641 [Homalodisca vitripennis]
MSRVGTRHRVEIHRPTGSTEFPRPHHSCMSRVGTRHSRDVTMIDCCPYSHRPTAPGNSLARSNHACPELGPAIESRCHHYRLLPLQP